jgi:coenzyme F420-reducing hydrogenase gamma subunit
MLLWVHAGNGVNTSCYGFHFNLLDLPERIFEIVHEATPYFTAVALLDALEPLIAMTSSTESRA